MRIYITALDQIQGSLRAAADDCQDEEGALRRGGAIDANMLHGALCHAKEGVAKLEKLIAAVATPSIRPSRCARGMPTSRNS